VFYLLLNNNVVSRLFIVFICWSFFILVYWSIHFLFDARLQDVLETILQFLVRLEWVNHFVNASLFNRQLSLFNPNSFDSFLVLLDLFDELLSIKALLSLWLVVLISLLFDESCKILLADEIHVEDHGQNQWNVPHEAWLKFIDILLEIKCSQINEEHSYGRTDKQSGCSCSLIDIRHVVDVEVLDSFVVLVEPLLDLVSASMLPRNTENYQKQKSPIKKLRAEYRLWSFPDIGASHKGRVCIIFENKRWPVCSGNCLDLLFFFKLIGGQILIFKSLFGVKAVVWENRIMMVRHVKIVFSAHFMDHVKAVFTLRTSSKPSINTSSHNNDHFTAIEETEYHGANWCYLIVVLRLFGRRSSVVYKWLKLRCFHIFYNSYYNKLNA